MSDVNKSEKPVEKPVEKAAEEKTVVNSEYLDNLYKDYPQVLEKWIADSPIPKKVLAPWKDSHVSQGLNTFKEKTMPELIKEAENKIKDSMNPVKTPEMLRIIALEEKGRQDELRAKNAEIAARAANYTSQLGIDFGNILAPVDLLRESEEATITLIDKFKEYGKYREEKGKKTLIKDVSYTPKDGGGEGVPYDGDPEKYAKAVAEKKVPYDQAVMDKIKEFKFRKR